MNDLAMRFQPECGRVRRKIERAIWTGNRAALIHASTQELKASFECIAPQPDELNGCMTNCIQRERCHCRAVFELSVRRRVPAAVVALLRNKPVDATRDCLRLGCLHPRSPRESRFS